MQKIIKKDGYELDWGITDGKRDPEILWVVDVFKKLPGYSVPQYVGSYCKHNTPFYKIIYRKILSFIKNKILKNRD